MRKKLKLVNSFKIDDGSNEKAEYEVFTHTTQTLKAVLESLVEEVEGKRVDMPKRKCINLENHLHGSCFQCEKSKGYNTALQDIKQLLQDIIKEVK